MKVSSKRRIVNAHQQIPKILNSKMSTILIFFNMSLFYFSINEPLLKESHEFIIKSYYFIIYIILLQQFVYHSLAQFDYKLKSQFTEPDVAFKN